MDWKGISDLTTTEGNLKNFTRICHLMKNGEIAEKQLVEQIRDDKTINRTNKKVIQRHLSILQHLRFITKDLNYCRLDSNGKMLCVLTANENMSKAEISEAEVLLYFRIFLTGKTLPQLALLLHTLTNSYNMQRNEIIYRYYENFLKTHLIIWNRIELKRRLNLYNDKGEFRRPEINRFDCMRYWLEQIRLMSKSKLSDAGKNFITFQPLGDLRSINWSDYRKKMFEYISYLFTFTESNNFVDFDPNSEQHNELFNEYFKEAYYTFGNRTMKTLDWVFIDHWIPMKLLWNDTVYIKRSNLDSLVLKLYKNKIIKSVIPGDYIGEKMIKIGEDNF